MGGGDLVQLITTIESKERTESERTHLGSQVNLRHFPLLEHLVRAEDAHQRRLVLIQLDVVTLTLLQQRDEARGGSDGLLEGLLSGGEVFRGRTRVVLAQRSRCSAQSIVLLHVVVRVVVAIRRLASVARLVAFRSGRLLLIREDGLCLAFGALLLLGDLLVDGHGCPSF
jgi:hypothetical protein